MTRKILHVACAAVAAALVFSAPPTAQFTGTCSPPGGKNCTGTGTGTLVLQNYTLGTTITKADFESFTYNSDLVSLSLNGSGSISGILGCFGSSCTPDAAPLPGPADVAIIAGKPVFQSNALGAWCATDVGGCGITDFGIDGTWSGIPLPAALPLFATGIGALGLLGWRRKRKAQAVA